VWVQDLLGFHRKNDVPHARMKSWARHGSHAEGLGTANRESGA
jgi:hypothetical protein